MKKVLIPVVGVGICLVVAFFLFRMLSADPMSSPPSRAAISVSGEPRLAAREQRDGRIKDMKARLAAIAAVPRRPEVDANKGWDGVPGDLDAMITSERIDEPAAAKYLKHAENFLATQQIDGTSILDATCGQALCRISFKHENADKFQQYRRQLYFAPWEGTSNYFLGTPNDDGSWTSRIWLGRDGYILPLEKLHQANASLL